MPKINPNTIDANDFDGAWDAAIGRIVKEGVKTTMRRAKGWWKWYWACLEVYATRVFDTVMVVSDGDVILASQARQDARLRHYWYEAGQNDKGQEVFFCWTLRKDASGHYRTWREVHTQTAIKRYDVVYKRTKAQAAEVARKRYNVFIGAGKDDAAPATELVWHSSQPPSEW